MPWLPSARRYRHRLRRGLESHGVLGVAREAAGRVVSVDEEYAWFVLDLERLTPITMPEGFDLHLAGEADTDLLRELPAVPIEEGRERVREGIQLWFVLKERTPAFVCFAFLGGQRFPLEGTRGKDYILPTGVACLENGLANREFRGRLIAPAAWTGIGERLRAAGHQLLMTKAAVSNVASCRTLERTGFRLATVMRRRRRGLRSSITFERRALDLTERERGVIGHLEAKVSR
jgi:hypothetical protein